MSNEQDPYGTDPESDTETVNEDPVEEEPERELHDPPIIQLLEQEVPAEEIRYISVTRTSYSTRAAFRQLPVGWIYTAQVGQQYGLICRHLARVWHVRADQIHLHNSHGIEVGAVDESCILTAQVRRTERATSSRSLGAAP